jgi:putative intracellular protease/amidase
MNNKIFVFLFEGFSDWEIAYLTPEINKSKAFDLVYFSKDGKPVSSMGGLCVQPNISLAEINIDDVHMLILPGGTCWEHGGNSEIDLLVQQLFIEHKTIAAICAATTYLAKQGFLDHLKHTSNDLFYLKHCAPQYKGDQNYINSFAVTDGQIITANGIATIEFAKEIFEKLNLKTKTDIEKWFQLFKNGIWSE